MSNLKIQVKKLTESAILPTKAYEDDAAWDLYADEECVIYPGQTKAMSTGLSFAIPKGYCGIIKERSGLSLKNLGIGGGVIDSRYRGDVKVILKNNPTLDFLQLMFEFNINHFEYKIEKGTKFAQILFLQVPEVVWEEVEELTETDRGEKGFGSSDLICRGDEERQINYSGGLKGRPSKIAETIMFFDQEQEK